MHQTDTHYDTAATNGHTHAPAMHGPVQLLLVSVVVSPYVPTGHAVHAVALPTEYDPVAHAVALATLVELAGQE